jgi:predicted nucleic acid-binding protein
MSSNPKPPKQKTVILDSSVWIAYLLEEDSNHLKAKEIMLFYLNSNFLFYIPDIVFYEVISVLIRLGLYTLSKYFSRLDLNIKNLERRDFLDVIFRYQYLFKTKTQDTLILIHCIKYNVDCFETFDLKQRTIYNNIRIL